MSRKMKLQYGIFIVFLPFHLHHRLQLLLLLWLQSLLLLAPLAPPLVLLPPVKENPL